MLRKSVGLRLWTGLVVVPADVVEAAGRIGESGVVVDMENASAETKPPDQKSDAAI
jgi:hypothetical protein